jgi:hypothetical protein
MNSKTSVCLLKIQCAVSKQNATNFQSRIRRRQQRERVVENVKVNIYDLHTQLTEGSSKYQSRQCI